MRLLVGFAAILILVSACTSDGSDGPGTSGNTPSNVTSTTPTTPPSTTPPTTAPPTSKSAPATPTVPADVPTTGPNTKPGETPPVLPVVGTTRTRAGAKAFAEFFIKTIDWGFATTNGAYIRHFASTSCATCEAFARTMDQDRAAGHRYIGGRFTIRSAGLRSFRSSNAGVRVTYDSLSFQEVDRNNDFVAGDRAYEGRRFIESLSWLGAWKVRSIAIAT